MGLRAATSKENLWPPWMHNYYCCCCCCSCNEAVFILQNCSGISSRFLLNNLVYFDTLIIIGQQLGILFKLIQSTAITSLISFLHKLLILVHQFAIYVHPDCVNIQITLPVVNVQYFSVLLTGSFNNLTNDQIKELNFNKAICIFSDYDN